MRKHTFILIAAALVSCASPVEEPISAEQQGVTWESGRRLRAKQYVAEDGTREFITWHDTVRQEDCSFDRFLFPVNANNPHRCYPEFSASQIGNVFSDSACTIPSTAEFSNIKLYWRDMQTDKAYLRGQKISAWYGDSSLCKVYPGNWYALGPEVFPSDFLPAVIDLEPVP